MIENLILSLFTCAYLDGAKIFVNNFSISSFRYFFFIPIHCPIYCNINAMLYIGMANVININHLENKEWTKAKVPVKIFCSHRNGIIYGINLVNNYSCYCGDYNKFNFVFASFYNIGKREII